MEIRVSHFLDFAYGDRRRDKSKVQEIINEMNEGYDVSKDRYKKFREALSAYEVGSISRDEFVIIYNKVHKNKSVSYKILAENYLNLKEDHGLVWDGVQRVSVKFDDLLIIVPWYLHTSSLNRRSVISLNFRKEPYPKKKEKGILTLLQIAEPSSFGVGILNIQASTLTVQNRIDEMERDFMEVRAGRFYEIFKGFS